MKTAMPPSHPVASLPAPFLPAALAAGVLLLATIITLRTAAVYRQEPVVFEIETPEGITSTDRVPLRDGRTLEQTFTVPHRFYATHIALRVHASPSTAPFTVSLALAAGSEALREAHLPSTHLTGTQPAAAPLNTVLVPDTTYLLTITTTGVAKGHDIFLPREIDATVVPGGTLTLRHEAGRSTLPGVVGFQLERRPTAQSIGHALARHPGVAALVLASCLAGLLLHPRLTERLRVLLRPESAVSPKKIPRRQWLVLALLCLLLAISVTWPLYTNPLKLSTNGDSNRMLVYRAVAREAYLTEQRVATWNPYLCSGEPLLANPESAHTDPMFLTTLLFGPELGLRLSITLALALTSLGSYLLARRWLRASPLPACLAAIVIPYAGFLMLAFGHGYLMWTTFWLHPWLMLTFLETIYTPRRLALPAGVLAWLFLGGSVHPALFGVLGLAIFAIALSIKLRRWQPIILALLISITAALIAAPKMLPMLELQALVTSFQRQSAFVPPPSWFFRMFLDRNQPLDQPFHDAATGIVYRWTDFGSYVGFLPLFLALVSLLRPTPRRHLTTALAALGAVALVMTFSPPPLHYIQELPVIGELLRNPQRIRFLFVLSVGLLAAAGLQQSTAHIQRPLLRHALQLGVVLVVTGDLLSYHAPLLPQVFSLSRPENIQPLTVFRRAENSYTTDDTEFYRAGYLSYLARQGTTDLCPVYTSGRPSPGRGFDSTDPARPYRGEAYLAAGGGTATLKMLTPTMLVVDVAATRPDRLIINQSFFPGWQTRPPRQTSPAAGLLSTAVSPSDDRLVFTYAPLSYQLGKIYLLAGLTFAGASIFRRY